MRGKRMNSRTNWPYVSCILCISCVYTCCAWTLADPRAEAIVVSEQEITEGNSVMLSCAVFNVSGERARSFRMEWRRDGIVLSRGKQVLSPDPRYNVTIINGEYDRRDFVLHIDPVSRHDAGQYICWVIVRDWLYPSVPKKRASSSVELRVRYFPQHPLCYHNPRRSNTFLSGTKVQIICSVDEGEPTVRTRWKGPNEIVLFANETHHDGAVVNNLTFTASADHDDMVFTCKVTSDAFPELTSSCRVGPIHVIQSASGQISETSESFSEMSVNDGESAGFSEQAPIPRTTISSVFLTTHVINNETSNPSSVTPKTGSVENGVPIIRCSINRKLSLSLSAFVVLFFMSAGFNLFLFYRLRRARRNAKHSIHIYSTGPVVPSICSGVSNEEYMDMHEHGSGTTEGEFYSTIGGDTMRSINVQYDSPRTSFAGASSPPTSGPFTNGIYENMRGRPVTPPRPKRKSRIIEEESL